MVPQPINHIQQGTVWFSTGPSKIASSSLFFFLMKTRHKYSDIGGLIPVWVFGVGGLTRRQQKYQQLKKLSYFRISVRVTKCLMCYDVYFCFLLRALRTEWILSDELKYPITDTVCHVPKVFELNPNWMRLHAGATI